VLKRYDPAIGEGHCLIRIGNARRNIGIVERVVEWIAKKDKAASPVAMPAHKTDGTEAEAGSIGAVRPIVRTRIRFVANIDPCLRRLPPHVPDDFPIRGTPRQPDCIWR